jgi:hypothetical protein
VTGAERFERAVASQARLPAVLKVPLPGFGCFPSKVKPTSCNKVFSRLGSTDIPRLLSLSEFAAFTLGFTADLEHAR